MAHTNIVKQFKDLGYDTDLQHAEDVIETQVSQIENMITRGVKALVIAAIDNKSLTGVLQQAKTNKIAVIAYDRLIRDTANVDYYATFDNFKVGVLEANYIVDRLGLRDGKGPFSIELFAGSPDDNNTYYFFNGAMSVIRASPAETSTRGIDVGAKYEIYLIVHQLAAAGKGVLIISSELPELLGLCDRVYAMSQGPITGELPKHEATQEAVMKLMTHGTATAEVVSE